MRPAMTSSRTRGSDQALREVVSIVDMPDRRAALLVRLLLQNGGRLSAAKPPQFAELSADEVAAMEQAVRAAMEANRPSD